MDGFLPYLLIAAGLYVIIAAAFNWSWFMNHRKAARIIKLFGQKGARAFYLAVGLVLSGVGTGLVTGIIPLAGQ